ncbi:MAG: CPBP family intramembrane metalloprotease, partial [Verrucomicrobiota bacterium]|nr:CPBP family intramembrane metalloprotease [Verrucomicrobiota bacterium]
MPDGFFTAFAAVINAIFLAAGVYIYIALVRQISSRPTQDGRGETKTFELPEAILAAALGTLFVMNALVAPAHPEKLMLKTNDLVANALISLALFVFVAAFLTVRGRRVNVLAGLSHVTFRRSLTTAVILLFAAYPLLFLADLVSQHVLRLPTSRQTIVELFSGSETLQQRVIIIILAVGIAPLVEEFVFRFFLYGVLRRYFGRFIGTVSNAMLFSAVHAHIPSAAPLFVLGLCFSIAYELSGSIFVSMSFYYIFNSMTLIALAFP